LEISPHRKSALTHDIFWPVVRIYSIGTLDARVKPMWHHQSVIVVLRIILRLLTDLIALTAFAFRRRRAAAAEILVLRRQIALYKGGEEGNCSTPISNNRRAGTPIPSPLRDLQLALTRPRCARAGGVSVVVEPDID